ncbi:hypothetical protein IW16_00270 [Chryseobacterium vrystaatense]|uniref:Secreted protein n=1 Tax=Chryseobacterium vrystaatense TaxID=307480 RepID=A0ABR4UQZ9_9FLAO|nr:hypothetical protein IW16_00270 [Chryseobacterium vrystaatense]
MPVQTGLACLILALREVVVSLENGQIFQEHVIYVLIPKIKYKLILPFGFTERDFLIIPVKVVNFDRDEKR